MACQSHAQVIEPGVWCVVVMLVAAMLVRRGSRMAGEGQRRGCGTGEGAGFPSWASVEALDASGSTKDVVVQPNTVTIQVWVL